MIVFGEHLLESAGARRHTYSRGDGFVSNKVTFEVCPCHAIWFILSSLGKQKLRH